MSLPDHLGLLGRIVSNSVTLEFFHHGFAADLGAAVEFYDSRFHIGPTSAEKSDLIAFLRSLYDPRATTQASMTRLGDAAVAR